MKLIKFFILVIFLYLLKSAVTEPFNIADDCFNKVAGAYPEVLSRLTLKS